MEAVKDQAECKSGYFVMNSVTKTCSCCTADSDWTPKETSDPDDILYQVIKIDPDDLKDPYLRDCEAYIS